MKTTPIAAPLNDEHILATWPTIRPDTTDNRSYSDPQWRQRLRFWAGRSLTAEALERDQRNKAGRLAWLGRVVTPGIVQNLAVNIEPPPTPDNPLTPSGHYIHISSGNGITCTGEDVVVPQPLRISLADIPILNPDSDNSEFPQVVVVVLRPAELRRFDNEDPGDPCELDPSRDAFADEQRLDATQVALFRLPDSLLAQFNLGDPTDPRWRNRLANAFLQHDSQQSKRLTSQRLESSPVRQRWGTRLFSSIPSPWDETGLPLAIISRETRTDTGDQRFFIDRFSVARRGAQPHPRSRPTTRLASEDSIASLNPHGAGNALNWRARIDQFADQLSEFGSDVNVSTLSGNFQYIPPVGLLPKSALQILSTSEADLLGQPDRAAVSRFFPSHLAIEARPVPIEDLDGVLSASAPLAPIDFSTSAPELIRILAPVSQASFDPDLLVIEQEDPIFLEEIGRLVAERQDLLQRRSFIKTRYDLLRRYSYGPPTSSVNPRLALDQLEPEPIEIASSFPFTSALRSPDKISGPAEITIPLPSAQPITESDIIFARIRTDADAPHPMVEIAWNTGSQSFSRRWTEAPAYPQEKYDKNGDPVASPLWRDFSVSAQELGIKRDSISSITLRLDSGSIALSQFGQLSEQNTQEQIWWNENSDGSAPIFKGGIWNPRSQASLVAPFEDLYDPIFSDASTLETRLDELDTSLKLPAGEQIRDLGITKIISNIEAEIKKGDDSVDLGFIKTQANIHRIRQVILGKEAANELLTSPALSSIIDSKSARLTTEELLAAYGQLPDKGVAEPIPTPPTDLRASNTAAPSGPATSGTSNAPLTFGAKSFGSPELFSTSFGGFDTGLPIENAREFKSTPASNIKFDPTKIDKNSFFNENVANPTKGDVLGSEPKIGQSFIPRDLTFTKRFDDGATNNAYSYSKAELESTFTQIPNLKLGIEDDSETIPEVTDRDGKPVTFGQISTANSTFLSGIIFPESKIPDGATNPDSSSILSNSVKLADLNVLVLRRFEFHIARRRALLAKAKETLAAMQAQIALMTNRLGVLAGKLSEARHDVSVARSLRQEELKRVADINSRRDKTLQEEVKFLAYVRPRILNTATYRLSGWKAKPDGFIPPLPACLVQHGEIPQALQSFTNLFKHSPARWFNSLKPKLNQLNRLENFQALLVDSQISAIQLTRESEPDIFGNQLPLASQYTIKSGFSLVRNWREEIIKTPFTPSITHGSERLRKEAEKRASLGDLISGKHGSSRLTRLASEELEKIEKVATCLHAEFSAVSPAVRLTWVERYSQFDQPAPLHDLSRLPHFQSFPRLTRQRFQEFVDWLFGRIDRSDNDAVAMMNDLVRICLLLASHAPIKGIVTGYVPRPTPIRPGVFIPILPFDPKQIRIDMQIQVWKSNSIVAYGKVADIKGQEVSAKVDSVTSAETTTIDSSMRIQFIEPQFTVTRQNAF